MVTNSSSSNSLHSFSGLNISILSSTHHSSTFSTPVFPVSLGLVRVTSLALKSSSMISLISTSSQAHGLLSRWNGVSIRSVSLLSSALVAVSSARNPSMSSDTSLILVSNLDFSSFSASAFQSFHSFRVSFSALQSSDQQHSPRYPIWYIVCTSRLSGFSC